VPEGVSVSADAMNAATLTRLRPGYGANRPGDGSGPAPTRQGTGGASPSPAYGDAGSTELGMIIGTAAYMAPEQARGRPVDRRADIWAFGIVLYEMLTGRRAFEGNDVSEVLTSVLKTAPNLGLVPDDVPESVRRLLRRCLEKDPRKRLSAI